MSDQFWIFMWFASGLLGSFLWWLVYAEDALPHWRYPTPQAILLGILASTLGYFNLGVFVFVWGTFHAGIWFDRSGASTAIGQWFTTPICGPKSKSK